MNKDFEIAVLARRRARIAVKADLKARGIRLSYVPVREIAALAKDYLIAHRAELLALATAEWKAISKPCARC
jgi:hypothetical protein